MTRSMRTPIVSRGLSRHFFLLTVGNRVVFLLIPKSTPRIVTVKVPVGVVEYAVNVRVVEQFGVQSLAAIVTLGGRFVVVKLTEPDVEPDMRLAVTVVEILAA